MLIDAWWQVLAVYGGITVCFAGVLIFQWFLFGRHTKGCTAIAYALTGLVGAVSLLIPFLTWKSGISDRIAFGVLFLFAAFLLTSILYVARVERTRRGRRALLTCGVFLLCGVMVTDMVLAFFMSTENATISMHGAYEVVKRTYGYRDEEIVGEFGLDGGHFRMCSDEDFPFLKEGKVYGGNPFLIVAERAGEPYAYCVGEWGERPYRIAEPFGTFSMADAIKAVNATPRGTVCPSGKDISDIPLHTLYALPYSEQPNIINDLSGDQGKALSLPADAGYALCFQVASLRYVYFYTENGVPTLLWTGSGENGIEEVARLA